MARRPWAAFIGVITTPTGQSISITNQPVDLRTNVGHGDYGWRGFQRRSALGLSMAKEWEQYFQGQQRRHTTRSWPRTTAASIAAWSIARQHLGHERRSGVASGRGQDSTVLVGCFLRWTPRPWQPNLRHLQRTDGSVTAANTANYALAPAAQIRSASLLANRRTVLLNTAALAATTDYTLTVRNVTDLASARNSIGTASLFKLLAAHYVRLPSIAWRWLRRDQQGTVGGATLSPPQAGSATRAPTQRHERTNRDSGPPMLRSTSIKATPSARGSTMPVAAGGWRASSTRAATLRLGMAFGSAMARCGLPAGPTQRACGHDRVASCGHRAGRTGTRDFYIDGQVQPRRRRLPLMAPVHVDRWRRQCDRVFQRRDRRRSSLQPPAHRGGSHCVRHGPIAPRRSSASASVSTLPAATFESVGGERRRLRWRGRPWLRPIGLLSGSRRKAISTSSLSR